MSYSFDFESFKEKYPAAIEGLDELVKIFKEIMPLVEESSRALGSENFIKTADSFNEISGQTSDCFSSVHDIMEDVFRQFSLIDGAVNG